MRGTYLLITHLFTAVLKLFIVCSVHTDTCARGVQQRSGADVRSLLILPRDLHTMSMRLSMRTRLADCRHHMVTCTTATGVSATGDRLSIKGPPPTVCTTDQGLMLHQANSARLARYRTTCHLGARGGAWGGPEQVRLAWAHLMTLKGQGSNGYGLGARP